VVQTPNGAANRCILPEPAECLIGYDPALGTSRHFPGCAPLANTGERKLASLELMPGIIMPVLDLTAPVSPKRSPAPKFHKCRAVVGRSDRRIARASRNRD